MLSVLRLVLLILMMAVLGPGLLSLVVFTLEPELLLLLRHMAGNCNIGGWSVDE